MTPELTALVLAALWQTVHFALYSVLAQKQVGSKYAASSRDTPRQLTGTAGRAQRAMQNSFEGLILFAIATLVITFADKGNARTTLACLVYLLARGLYLPAYLFDWVPWRSVIWLVGFLATNLLFVMALF
ncbi:MAPEG family protein [Cognatishimia sp. F0-27]|uniref:MAPEG family protein n=1 Tax=Cognatishimia sp. F0-27 TaxID=2816855 RepID=UPI001D0C5A71|nr:MAPEG family protein [Cognatishimia sp. F0-27]MCC1491534.1 MAPEG family protein [Cognatishimia sp. F0-27]